MFFVSCKINYFLDLKMSPNSKHFFYFSLKSGYVCIADNVFPIFPVSVVGKFHCIKIFVRKLFSTVFFIVFEIKIKEYILLKLKLIVTFSRFKDVF